MFLWVCLHVHICLTGFPDKTTEVEGKRIVEADREVNKVKTGKVVTVKRRTEKKRYFILLREQDCGFTKICRYWEKEVSSKRYDAFTIGDTIWFWQEKQDF